MSMFPPPWMAAGDQARVWIVLGVLVLVLGGAALVHYFSAEVRTRRTMRRVPRRSLRDRADGKVGRFVGTVRELEATLEAPLTGRRCVVYRATLLEKVGKRLRVVVREQEGVPFLLEDGPTSVRVDPKDAFLLLDEHLHTSSGFWQGEPDARAAAFLERHGEEQGWLFLRRSLRYREEAIEVGEELAVLGRLVRRGDASAPAHLAPAGESPLVLSDEPGVLRA